MEYRVHNKGEKRLHFTFKFWKMIGLFDILNYISKYVALIQLIDTVGDFIHAVSISRNWIFN